MPAKRRPQPPQHTPAIVEDVQDGQKVMDSTPSHSAKHPLSPPEIPSETSPVNGQRSVSTDMEADVAPTVNRKKQKRREKQAAKLAAQVGPGEQNGYHGVPSTAEVKQQIRELEAQFREHGLTDGLYPSAQSTQDDYRSDEDPDPYLGNYPQRSALTGYDQNGTSNKQVRMQERLRSAAPYPHPYPQPNGHANTALSLPPMPAKSMPRGAGISKEKIWNTSSQEERERIKEFWLSLGEEERKSLVKVEKDAVLKKMKEQQKHSCSCTVCGRKRTAIEEELEVLYDAYYEELEQYANHRGENGMGPMLPPPPRRFGELGGLQSPHALPEARKGPLRGRIVEQIGDDEDEYSEEGIDEDEYSEEEPPDLPGNHASDFFTFGNSLEVRGGILTVADDLLKNDGKRFIEMMEQLAERRMAREVDTHQQYAGAGYSHPPNGSFHTHQHPHTHPHTHNHPATSHQHSHPHTHNHNLPPPPPEDEEYDEEDDEEEEEYDSQEDEYDDEEMASDRQCGCTTCTNARQDTMTEEQRMEEGRRMFQIFAARMFEQRVLTAYKEKVAKERQEKLLEELEEESRADSQKKAKKAKDAQKKKDKLAQKKQAQAEKEAKLEADKAAREAAARLEEERRLEDQRQKADEKRKRKDALKKAEEEERAKREAEKQKRMQEQRDRQAEAERKQREAKEKERKDKDDQKLRDKESREAKEREVKARKDKQDQVRRDKETKTKADKAARDRERREESQAQQAAATAANNAAAQALKRNQTAVPVPNSKPVAPVVPSPRVQVAIPSVPKPPTPIKLRTSSQQDSSGSSIPATPLTGPKSSTVSPPATTPSQSSPGPSMFVGKPVTSQPPPLQHPQASSPLHSALKAPPMNLMHNAPGPFPHAGMGLPTGLPMMNPTSMSRPQDSIFAPPQLPGHFRPILGPNGMPMHAGMPLPQVSASRVFSMQQPPPGFAPQPPNGINLQQIFGHKEPALPPPQHHRQQSGSFEKPLEHPSSAFPAQPIARPAPIGRPSSVVHGHQYQGSNGRSDVDDLSNHLGSSALLDDSDDAYDRATRRGSLTASHNFAPPFGQPAGLYNTWGGPPHPFGSNSLPGSGFNNGWGPPVMNNFGGPVRPPPIRASQPRSVAVRLMICHACKGLEASSPDGFLDIHTIKEHVDLITPPGESPVSEKELLDICDTEGNLTNGGGFFSIRLAAGDRHEIRYEADAGSASGPSAGPVGAPGSPIVAAVGPVGAGGAGLAARIGPPGF